MSKIKGYFTTIVIVFVVQIIFLSFAFVTIKNHGYNPNKDFCNKTCFKKMNVDVQLDEKGEATFVEEYRAYREKAGNYIYVDHSYDQAIGEEIDRTSIKLLSGDGELEPIFEKSNTSINTRFKINTHFKGEETFKFSYKVRGLVKNLKDGQIFKYNFFNNEYSSPVIDAKINIQVPTRVFDKSTLWFDGLRSQSGVQKNTDMSTYTIDIPKRDHIKKFYEVNMTFPRNSFIYASQIPKASFSTIEEYNKEIDKVIASDQAKSNNAEIKILVILIGTIAALPITLLILFFIYKTREKPYRKIDNETAYWSVPANISPLTASMIISKENLADLNDGFKADILYLVSKGYVNLTTINDVVTVTKIKEIENETESIGSLYQFLFNNRNEVRLSKNRGYVKEEQDNFKQYCDKTLATFREMNFYETLRGGYKKTNGFSLKLQIIVAVVFISVIPYVIYNAIEFVGAAYVSTLFLFILVVCTLVGYCMTISRLRANKIAEYEQWKGYKNYLSNYTLLKERNVNDIFVWKQHLAYATAFGVAENVLRVLKTEFPELATAVESDIPLGTGFYVGTLISTPSAWNSSSRGLGDFGSGGGFSGGGFSGGGSGGGGGGFG